MYNSCSCWVIFSSESHCFLGVGNMRKYCLNCGKKFYPKGYYSYPDTEYEYDYENRTSERHEVPIEHKHFHSLNCMKVWLAKNHEAFTLLLTSMGNNDSNNETIQKG
jgi:hypothetical protein